MFSEAHNEWRKHPLLQRRNNIGKMLPGFGSAVVIFGVYVFAEAFYDKIQKKRAHSVPKAPDAPEASS